MTAFTVETHQSTAKVAHTLHCHLGTVLVDRHSLQSSLLGEMDLGRWAALGHWPGTRGLQCRHSCWKLHHMCLHYGKD